MLIWQSALEISGLVRAKKLSPIEVTDAVLSRIDAINPVLNAFCVVAAEQVRAAAREAEIAVTKGEPLGPLHGVPVSIKDVLFTRGLTTTGGSRLFADHVPDEDAIAVARLRAAGALVLGKTNTSEFGHKAVTENPLFGVTKNPWNPALTPGGSSGGAAVAVASGCGPVALGTDGGGSIRIPAAFCGAYGFKPSYGRVPDRGGFPSGFAHVSHVGPLTRTLRYARADPRVTERAGDAAAEFESLGCHVEVVNPGWEDPEGFFGTMIAAQFYAAWSDRLPEAEAEMDPTLVKFIRRGGAVTARDYVQALGRVDAYWREVHAFLERFDLLLMPTVAVLPFPAGQAPPREIAGGGVSVLGWMPFTFPFNLTGQPAASVPAGWTGDGLPVGLQIVGRRHADATVLAASAAFEEARPWSERRPAL